MFNALKYTQDLEKAGFTSEQAKASLNLLIDVMNESFATKADLVALKSELKGEIQEVRSDLVAFKSEVQAEFQSVRADIRALDAKVDHRIEQLRSDLTIRLGSMMAVCMGLLATIIKLM